MEKQIFRNRVVCSFMSFLCFFLLSACSEKTTVQFAQEEQTVAKASPGGSIQVNLKRSSKRTVGLPFVPTSHVTSEVLVPYTVSGTAQSGVIHNLSNGTLRIPSGAGGQPISFQILDGSFQGSKTIVVQLSSPSEGQLGEKTTHTVYLSDGETSGYITINNGALTTYSQNVTLSFSASGVNQMYVTNIAGCGSGGSWEPYATSKNWTLAQSNSLATVYVKFRDAALNETICYSDDIIHAPCPTESEITLSNTLGGLEPDVVDAYIASGDPVTFPVTVTVPESGGGNAPLDLVLLEDLSGSFGDDVSTIQGLVSNLIADILNSQPDTLFGMASFVDKPTGFFGGGGDYVFQLEQVLTAETSDPSDFSALQTTVNNLQLRGGGDGPEAQLESLFLLAKNSAAMGFRPTASHVVVLFTDANYHVAGDASMLPPNNGDAVADGTPAGTGEDYPSVAQLKSALEAANIVPVFAATSNAVATYENLVSELGRGTVVTLSSNSSNIVNAVTTGLEDVLSDVTLTTVSDGFGYVTNVTPTSFLDVEGPTTLTFSVTLSPVLGGPTDSFELVVPGYGSTTVNVTGCSSSKRSQNLIGIEFSFNECQSPNKLNR